MFIVAFPTTVYPNPAPPPPAPFFPSTPALATPFFCFRVFFVLFFFFPFFAPNHAACVRSGIRIDTDTDIHHPRPPSSDPIPGWWSLYRRLSPSRASPPPLSLSISLSPSFSRCPSNRERYSTVFRISEMAREGWLTIFYCSNRPTNDPCREI